MPEKEIRVRVALRCRPLIPKERTEGCCQCLQFIQGEPQVILGTDKAFTFDFVFNPDTPQESVYNRTVKNLVKGVFKGYNATVLAYGQTGSGKTHTMGGGYGVSLDQEESIQGIIPRVLGDLFEGVHQRAADYDFTIRVSYLEIYREELMDLLVPTEKRDKDAVSIREDTNGGIKLVGLKEEEVHSYEGMMACLERGSHSRTVGATAMNAGSSRSHAIFTIHLERTSKNDSNDFCKAKFHLVDLAGSERQKKTQAEGDRFKEGVNINKGLLALGNVISALGEEAQKRSHIPYRDSKLTRLLQDSLGGNSHTVMIACVSPADSNMEETLSTLRYADRARKIKNKPIVNRDPAQAEIIRLRALVQSLQMQGLQPASNQSVPVQNASSPMPKVDVQNLKGQIKKLEEDNDRLIGELREALDQNMELTEKVITADVIQETLTQKLDSLKERVNKTVINETFDGDTSQVQESMKALMEIQHEITQLKLEQMDCLSTIPEDSKENESDTKTVIENEEANEDVYNQRQAQMSKDIQQLNKLISKKQALCGQVEQNEEMMSKVREGYENTLKELEGKIEGLQKERGTLEDQLVSAKTNHASSKVSEQRRKRVRELETQISDFRKKMVEQSKALKKMEQQQKQVTTMNSEIKSMKQQRVKLMKQLKEEADHFRKFKQEKDKEVLQLKAKDRKRQVELVKLEKKYERGQAVMKRKAEEAAAANRRLKEALQKQKSAAEERDSKMDRHEAAGKFTAMKRFLLNEIEVLTSIEEARHHMQSLIEDRKDLNNQLTNLKNRMDNGPPLKKMQLNDSSCKANDESHDRMRVQIKDLERDIDFRNAQITDIQQKLMDSNQDDKTKSRFTNIHSVVDAKHAMKFLLNMVVTARVESSKRGSKEKDLKEMYSEANRAVESAEQQLKELTDKYEEEKMAMQAENEKKVLFLLSQMNKTNNDTLEKTSDEDLRNRIQFQEKEINRLASLEERFEDKEKESEALRRELVKVKLQGPAVDKGDTSYLMPELDPGALTPFNPRAVSKTKKMKKKQLESPPSDEYDPFSDESEEELEDAGSDVDPDWVKTPMYGGAKSRLQRVQKTRRGRDKHMDNSQDSYRSLDLATPEGAQSGTDSDDRQNARSTDTTPQSDTGPSGCKCKGSCATKQCSCKKGDASCGDLCKCSTQKCKNRTVDGDDTENDISQPAEDTSQTSQPSALMNTTFDLGKSDLTFTEQDSQNTGTEVLKAKDNTDNVATKRTSGDPVEAFGARLKKKRKLQSKAGGFFSALPLADK